MREIRTIEVDRWEPSEKPGMVKHVGMISPQEAFDALEKHLKESDLMPDEYFQSNAYAWDGVKELPNYIRASCDVNWGGSEGIYLDVSLLYRDVNREIQRFYFATGKTLGTSGDDFLRMSRIAAECSMMLNGRGEVVRFQDENAKVVRDENVLSGDYDAVRKQVLDGYRAEDVELAEWLSSCKTPDLSIEYAVRLYADLKHEVDGDRVVRFLDDSKEAERLWMKEEPLLGKKDVQELLEEYFDEREEQNSPLFAFIEKEVLFRMRELMDIDISDEDLSIMIDAVKENADVMFDYDGFDSFLMERYEDLLGLDRQKINVLRGEICNLRHELDGAAAVDPDLVPELDKRLAVAECKLDAALQGVSIALDPDRIIDADHLDCFWYGGVIGSMTYKGYEMIVKVSGDVNASFLSNKGGEVLCSYKNKNNTGVQKTDEVFAFIDNDSDLNILDEQGRIAWENNNWVEFFVLNPAGKQIELPNVETVLGNNVLDAFVNVGWFKAKVDEYEQNVAKKPLNQLISDAGQNSRVNLSRSERSNKDPER